MPTRQRRAGPRAAPTCRPARSAPSTACAAGGHPVLTLVAFANAPKSEQMCDIVFSTAAGTGSDVVQMDESDISEDLALFIAAKAHASPETGVLVVPGGEWDLDGAGREVAHRSRTMDS